jgi:sugar lactone lactonase YvrE
MGTAGVSAAGGGVVWTDPDLAIASYDNSSFATSGLTACTGLQFNSNGTKMYVGAFTGGVKEHNLSTAWDSSTASASGNSIASSNTQSLHFKPDGTVIFVGSGSDIIEYPVSTAYDLSTVGSGTTTSFSGTMSFVRGISFNSDGSKLYALDNSVLYEHTLSTNYDVSTSTGSTSKTLNNDSMDLFFDPNGYYAYVAVGNAGSTDASSIIEYTLTTAFDISTLNTTPTNTFSTSSQETDPQGLAFKADGSKMYVVGTANNTVYQYTTPAAVTWTDPDIANASYDSVSFSVATQQINSRGVTFKSDGTKLYVVGSDTNIVYAYDLSTAWDITTATYNSENGSVNSQETNATDLIFKPDGTKMYALGLTSDTVYQYSLSTAWDVSTLSYDNKSISVASQDAIPTGIILKSDGTSFYMCGTGNDYIYQYDMTTAYDISTASYANKSVSVSTNPLGLFLNPDDDQIYYCDSSSDLVYAYDLTTAGDLSTAVNTNTSFSTGTQMAACQGVTFKSDGSKAYVIDYFNNTVYQYST